MTNQLYHLIPEPAGDWQEGDRHVYLPDANYRLRPVKAQAGQLWRVEWDEDIYKVTDGIEVIGMGLSSIKANRLCDLLNRPVPAQAGPLWRDLLSELLTWQGEIIPVLNDEVFRASHVRKLVREVLSVQAQACACEGLRKVCKEAYEMMMEGGDRLVMASKLDKALAQSCQQSGEQPISEKGGDASWRNISNTRSSQSSAVPESNPPAAASEAQDAKFWHEVVRDHLRTIAAMRRELMRRELKKTK